MDEKGTTGSSSEVKGQAINKQGNKQQHNKGQGKAGKPYREIYRPPSLRTKPNRKSINKGDNNGQKESQAGNQTGSSVSNGAEGVKLNSQSNNNNNNNNNNNGVSSKGQNNVLPSQNGNANGGGGGTGSGSNSVPNSPMVSRHSFNFNNNNAPHQPLQSSGNRSLNVNAKEFQFTPSLQQQQQQQIQSHQQLASLLSQLDPSFYENAAGALLASSVGVYSLQQSKSVGNNLNSILLQKQIHHQMNSAAAAVAAAANNVNRGGMPFGPNPFAFGFQNSLPFQQQQSQQNHQMNFGPVGSGAPFNRLSQSKSSGNISSIGAANVAKPRVRFDDEDSDDETYRNSMKNAETGFASMKLNGDSLQSQQLVGSPKSPILPTKSVQKSRTGFYLNMFNSTSTTNPFGSSSSPPQMSSSPPQQQGILKSHPLQQGKVQQQQIQSTIKRSRSFGSGVQGQHQQQVQLQMAQRGSGFSMVHSVYSDFQISRWPKNVQESVTAAVTAVERVAARTQIEMVNMIFNAMLNYSTGSMNGKEVIENKVESKAEQDSSDADDNWRSNSKESNNNKSAKTDNETDKNDDYGTDLTSAAVHIFLYFIQREKDRTVKESLLNVCFDTYKKLFGSGQPQQSPSTLKDAKEAQQKLANQSSTFLRFLSALYSQVKLLRRQMPKQPGTSQAMDEMSFTLLALLCDSCLATLRSKRSNEPHLMECLFTVMTSQGRDMETTFPLKMKQLLAAVRDALLGLGPYAMGPLSPMVQKTLMQLIELHAANWALPASAVRYYYSSNPSSNNNNNGTPMNN